jgi:hypothetical protein
MKIMSDNEQRDNIDQIDQAWQELENSIHTTAQSIREFTAGSSELTRYEGYKTVLAMLAENYVNQLHSDPRRPELMPTVGSLFNYAGPAPDFNYYIAHITPGDSYRVWGKRGNCELIDVQQMVGWYGKGEKFSVNTVANELFDEKGIHFDDKGNFDFILSPQQQDGDYWHLDKSVTTLLIREYFTDYATQDERSAFHIDRLCEDEGTSCVQDGEGAIRIKALAQSLSDYAYTLSLPEVVSSQVGVNQCFEFNFDDAGGVLNHRYLQARWDIQPGQALVVKWIFPQECLNWSIALYNDFYQLLNYANRQVNLNAGLSIIDDSREFYFVLSHEDPGIANWLDIDGHDQGQVLIRTKNASAFEPPTMKLVDINELENHLPDDIAKVDLEQRAEQLAVRRRHFQLREGR